MEQLNVIRHMNEFRNILSYAANVGFFFGAGTSCSFGLPTIVQLTEKVKGALDSDQLNTYENIEVYCKDLTGKPSVTIEDVLNHLREVRNLTKSRADYDFKGLTGEAAEELDHEICNAVFKIIKYDTERADVSDLRRFFAWFDSAYRGFIKEVFTANYDMLFEMAMEANRTPYFDGFTGAYEPFFSPESIEVFPGENDSTNRWIRLWKMHGSLNWMKKTGTHLSSEHIIRVGKFDEPKNELMIYPSKEKYTLSRKEPFVAYFDRFRNYLSRGELVFIIAGYSFGDEHINEVIFNALRNNSRLFVTVLCYEDQQIEDMKSYASAYTNLWVAGPKYTIANGIKKEWVYDDTDDQDTGSGMYWDAGRKSFLLGDFRRLIDFLIENSGRKKIIEEIVNGK